MVTDILAAGVDPARATFYLQSAIPEVGDLNTLFQNLVTVPRLERVPSLKEMARDAGKEEMPYGLLGYPVLQAADILCVKGQVVPVGKDNAAHVEVTREIARRFNHLYGEVFPVPEMIASGHADPGRHRRPGEDEQEPGQRHRALRRPGHRPSHGASGCTPTRTGSGPTCPGTVEGNPVFAYHDVFNPDRAGWPT